MSEERKWQIDAREVRRLAEGRWEQIYSALAPELQDAVRVKGRHVPCPVHGGKDGFRLHRTATNGLGICNSCPEFGGKYLDGFDILQWIRGWRFGEALEEVASIVGAGRSRAPGAPIQPVAARPLPEHNKDEDLKAVERMRKVWSSSVPITHPTARIGRRYLESRGLPAPTAADGLDDVLHFVPALDWWDEDRRHSHRFPALIGRLQNSDGMTVALHRIYLALDGTGKAPVPPEQTKKMMPRPQAVSCSTAAIRLGPQAQVVAIAEGVETALAVRAFTGIVCWSAYSSSLLQNFVPPEGVRGVAVFGDLDANGAGQSAAKALVEVLESRGIHTRLALPPEQHLVAGMKSLDWLDVFQRFGKDAVAYVPWLARRSNVIAFQRSA